MSTCTDDTLEMILNRKNVVMNYVNYETAIVEKYKVELAGWPQMILFANPSAIGMVEEIRTLRNALKTGETKWIVQGKRKQAAHAEMLKAKRNAGEVVGKKRKERSDKGKKRKAATIDSGDDDESPPPQKRKTNTRAAAAAAKTKKKIPPAVKSAEFIGDTDDDDEEGNAE